MKLDDRLRGVISISLAGLGFYVVVSSVDLGRAFSSLRSADIGLFAAGSLVLLAVYGLMAERWRMILAEKAVNVSRTTSFRHLLISDFFNSFVPARGGDIYRGYLASNDERSTVETSTMVLMERIMDVIAIAVLAAGVVAAAFPGSGLLIYPLLVLAAALAALLWLRVLRRLETIPVQRLQSLYARSREVVLENLTTSRGVELMAVTVLIWLMGVGRTHAVFASLGMEASLMLVAAVTFIWAIIASLPITPSGYGATDATVFVFLQQSGFDPAVSAAFLALNRLMLQGVPLVLGGFLHLERTLRQ